MEQFRKKQRKNKKILNILLIISAVYMFLYIGAEPILAKQFGGVITMISAYIAYALILASLIMLFIYTSKYSKCDKYLEAIEYELSDAGYYFTSRTEKTPEQYLDVMREDLVNHGFDIKSNIEIDGFEFDLRAVKGKEYIYIVCVDDVDKNDVIAYQESAIYDVTATMLKRKGNAVVVFISNKVQESAVELSKVITPIDKKERMLFSNAIVELDTGRCYFLGNKPAKSQQMIANYVMNCEIPIKDKYIGKEKLPYQHRLKEHMNDFNLKDYNNGTFSAH
ncbi:MAG TPA: hypothetical protein DCZ02_00075 [Ruminococcaceae bacterium]|nr:hypothetical protein [Oscillospiraceae bacterium]